MFPGFQIGPLAFHYYGLILSAALLATFLIAKFAAKKENLPQSVVEEAAIILIIPTILGARIYHVLDYWDYYSGNLPQIFFIWQGGIGIIGAIPAGLLALFAYSKFRKINFLKLADIAAPAVALGQSIGRIGNLINLEGFGPPTNLPWGIYIESFQRPEIFAEFEKFHPTFFYEAIGDFLIFLILILAPVKKPGIKFATYLVLYSTLRFGLEFLRIDTWQIGIVKIAQIITLGGFLLGIFLIYRLIIISVRH